MSYPVILNRISPSALGVYIVPDKIVNAGKTPLWKTKNVVDWANATGRNNKGLVLDNSNLKDNNEIDELQNFQVQDLKWEG